MVMHGTEACFMVRANIQTCYWPIKPACPTWLNFCSHNLAGVLVCARPIHEEEQRAFMLVARTFYRAYVLIGGNVVIDCRPTEKCDKAVKLGNMLLYRSFL